MERKSSSGSSFFLVLLVLILVAPLAFTGQVTGAGGQLPLWEEGFSWTYEIDMDVDLDLLGFLHVDHFRDNWTRTVTDVYEEGDETVYKIYEEHRGRIAGTIEYIVTIPVSADADATGWTYVRARDMTILNQTLDTTFTSDYIVPIGRITGGFENRTVYDPPVPILQFPLDPPTPWDVVTTINHTSRWFISYPTYQSTWDNSTGVIDVTVTPSAPAPVTVPAGTYSAFKIHEEGTYTSDSNVSDIDRNWYHADTITWAVRTPEAYRLTATTAIYIPPNGPPVGPAEPLELSTDEDTPLDITMTDHFSDPDGDKLSFILDLMGPSVDNATLSGSGPARTLTPTANWSGTLSLKATARDPHGSNATADIVVTVLPVNDPPNVVSPPLDQMTDEDVPLMGVLTFSSVFDDVDGDALAFEAVSELGVMAVINGTVLDLLPEQDWVGNVRVNITAVDPHGLEAHVSFRVLVGAVNDPPTIVSSSGPGMVHEGTNGTYQVVVEDMDSTDLEYRWEVDGVTVPGETGNGFVLEVGDLDVSEVVVSVSVKDEWGAIDSRAWTVRILDSPRIMDVSPEAHIETLVGDTVSFSVTFEDADTPSPDISWYWRDVIVGLGNTLDLVLGAFDEGNWTLRVVVSDGVAEDTAEWFLSISVPNLPPTVGISSPIDGAKYTIGETFMLRATVDDEDLRYVTVRWYVDGSPVGTGTMAEYLAGRAGTLVIEATADDGVHSASDSVTVTVSTSPSGDGDGEEGASNWGVYLLLVLLLVAVAMAVYVLRRKRGPRD